MIELALIIIVVFEIFQGAVTLKSIIPRGKKGHFNNKLRGIRNMIHDLEFKRFKLNELREEQRKERDRLKEAVATIDAKLTEYKGNTKVTEGLEKEKEPLAKKLDGVEDSLKMIDAQLKSTDPDLPPSIQAEIDAAYSLMNMLKEYKKKNV